MSGFLLQISIYIRDKMCYTVYVKMWKGVTEKMYNIGDKILYPSHGAGVVDGIEEKKVLGKKQFYYTLKMPEEGMKVMIPADGSNDIGIRPVIDCEEGKKALKQFHDEPIVDDVNWNRRQRENITKIKTGDIYQVISVVKNLMYRERTKGLSTSERKMLVTSRRIFASEIVLSGAAEMSDVQRIMEDSISELL